MTIGIGYLRINENGRKYVLDCIDNNRLSRGKYTTQFEKQFAEAHQCKHGIFCNSGTSALQIALATLKEIYGYEDGDEVIVPALTFVATGNIVLHANLKPVFVDVDPYTFNINPKLIEEKITPRTRAIIPVHLMGLPCNMPEIMEIAKKHNLQVIEDSCETVLAKINGKSVGSFGDMSCFSCYVAHLIVGGVGGLVTTNRDDYAILCRSYLAHGRDHIYLSIDDDDNISDKELEIIMKRRLSFDRIGYSYRATELEAAIALSELEQADNMIKKRRHNAAKLMLLLSKYEDLQLAYIPLNYEHSFMNFPVVVSDKIDRDKLLMHLERKDIETRYIYPLLIQPIYRDMWPGLEYSYPVAKKISEKGFFIGIHQGLEYSDLEYVAKVFEEYFKD